MTQSIENCPISSVLLEEVVTNITNAFLIEETSLSDILRAENDMIQKAKQDSANLEEFVAVNESVNGVIKNIIEIQAMTRTKLQLFKDLLQKLGL